MNEYVVDMGANASDTCYGKAFPWAGLREMAKVSSDLNVNDNTV